MKIGLLIVFSSHLVLIIWIKSKGNNDAIVESCNLEWLYIIN